MEQAAKLQMDTSEALAKIRSLWLSRLIHDFRGPLFAARGYAKLIVDQRAGSVTDTQREYLNQIIENTSKLSSLVDALATFPSDQALRLDFVSLSEMIVEYVREETASDATLQINAPLFSVPATTIGDRDKLTFAVHKLLGVAVDFSRSGGEVQIQAKQEDDEFSLRICATPGESISQRTNAADADIAMALEALRLHGGAAHVDRSNAGRCHITVRLPLVNLENQQVEARR